MTQKVSHHENGFTNSALPMPYCLSWLSCGHAKSGELPLDTAVNCNECDRQAESLVKVRAVASRIHHGRFKRWCGRNLYYFYELNHASPSNFYLIASCEATPEADALLRELRISPLSPTERA